MAAELMDWLLPDYAAGVLPLDLHQQVEEELERSPLLRRQFAELLAALAREQMERPVRLPEAPEPESEELEPPVAAVRLGAPEPPPAPPPPEPPPLRPAVERTGPQSLPRGLGPPPWAPRTGPQPVLAAPPAPAPPPPAPAPELPLLEPWSDEVALEETEGMEPFADREPRLARPSEPAVLAGDLADPVLDLGRPEEDVEIEFEEESRPVPPPSRGTRTGPVPIRARPTPLSEENAPPIEQPDTRDADSWASPPAPPRELPPPPVSSGKWAALAVGALLAAVLLPRLIPAPPEDFGKARIEALSPAGEVAVAELLVVDLEGRSRPLTGDSLPPETALRIRAPGLKVWVGRARSLRKAEQEEGMWVVDELVPGEIFELLLFPAAVEDAAVPTDSDWRRKVGELAVQPTRRELRVDRE